MGRLVLIADEERARAERIGEACSVRGFSTQIVDNGAEALETALQSVPDVLVASASLGVIEASRVADILRTNPRTHNIQFVVLSEMDAPDFEEGGSRPPSASSHPDEVARRVEALVGRDPQLDPAQAASRAEEEVHGQVAQIPIPDLLQLFHLNRRSGTIELRRRTAEGRETRGRIHLRDGDVVQAVAGPVEGEKALFRLLGWTDGSFSFRPERVALAPRIQTPTRALLLEGLRQVDEWKRTHATLPSLDSRVSLRVTSAELPNVVHPLTQEVLLLLEIYSTVGDLIDHCTFPDYQVLRTLQTLESRGIVEFRAGPPPRPPEVGLFTEAQTRRLREWMAPRRPAAAPPRDAKVLIVSAEPDATRDFVRLLESLPGIQLEAAFRSGSFGAQELTRVGRLSVDADLGLEFVHLPTDASFASLWQVAGYGALGTLVLLSGSVAKAHAAIRPVLESLQSLPRARVFHVLLVRKDEGVPPEEIRQNLDLLEEGSLFLLPLDDGRDPAALLRSAVSRILP